MEKIRGHFPILKEMINKNPLVYLDNAATAPKPRRVMNALIHHYLCENSNIHRGGHHLGQVSTGKFEMARMAVARFLKAQSPAEIIFTKGTTDSINLVANSFGECFLEKNDEILLSAMEHHSNIVPWQMVAQRYGAKIKVIPIDSKGNLGNYQEMINDKTKILSITHVSNVLGTINPIKEIIQYAQANGVYTFIDAAQSVPHMSLNVQDLDCDFLAFSGHKIYGPTGIGVLYGKQKILDQLPPYQTGGAMISRVTFENTTFNDLPYKFEAGTPHIAGAIGLMEAINFVVEEIGLNFIQSREDELMNYAQNQLEKIPQVQIIGKAANKSAVISWICKDIHHQDIGSILDRQGVAIRTGHHCCAPLMNDLGINGTCRASLAFYNTHEEIDILTNALKKAIQFLGQ